MTGTCKLCGQVKKLAKAHIIPRTFFLKAKGVSKNSCEARRHDTKEVKLWQNGIWDDGILCEGCDNGFSSWDDYGFKVLGEPPGKNELPKNDAETEAFVIKGIDYERLKLFILSVLWRASVSSQPFFNRVQLGKHEVLIAGLIQNHNPGADDQFQVVLARLVEQKYPNVIFPPCRQRTPEGINFNVLFLPSIKIMVKVDRQPLPKILEPVVFSERSDNFVMPMPLLSNEVQALRNGAEIFRRRLSKQ